MEELTEKQHKLLKFIEQRIDSGNPASQREMGKHFKLSQNAIYQLIGYLKQKGYIVNEGGHRGLRLSKQYIQQRKKGLPLVGRVAAGEPILADENIEDYVQLKELLGLSDDVFFLRVSGDSMVDEGIMDGDLVAVKPAGTVENGKIAVVLLDDEATVKRVFFEKNRIALKPANTAEGYKTRYITSSQKDIRIVGRVIGCVRTIR